MTTAVAATATANYEPPPSTMVKQTSGTGVENVEMEDILGIAFASADVCSGFEVVDQGRIGVEKAGVSTTSTIPTTTITSPSIVTPAATGRAPVVKRGRGRPPKNKTSLLKNQSKSCSFEEPAAQTTVTSEEELKRRAEIMRKMREEEEAAAAMSLTQGGVQELSRDTSSKEVETGTKEGRNASALEAEPTSAAVHEMHEVGDIKSPKHAETFGASRGGYVEVDAEHLLQQHQPPQLHHPRVPSRRKPRGYFEIHSRTDASSAYWTIAIWNPHRSQISQLFTHHRRQARWRSDRTRRRMEREALRHPIRPRAATTRTASRDKRDTLSQVDDVDFDLSFVVSSNHIDGSLSTNDPFSVTSGSFRCAKIRTKPAEVPEQEEDRNKSLSTPVNRRLSYTPMEVEQDFEALMTRYYNRADERGTFPEEERRPIYIRADWSAFRAENDEEQAYFDEAMEKAWRSRKASRTEDNSAQPLRQFDQNDDEDDGDAEDDEEEEEEEEEEEGDASEN